MGIEYQLSGRALSPEEMATLESVRAKKIEIVKKQGLLSFYDSVNDFTQTLKDNFPLIGQPENKDCATNYQHYFLFHVMVGSSPRTEYTREFDFPMPHSVTHFLDNLERSLKPSP